MDNLRKQADVTKRTCIEPECSKPHTAQGFCSSHYSRARKAGLIQVLEKTAREHELSDVDEKSGLATCRSCGPGVPYRVRSGKRVCSDFILGQDRAKRAAVSERNREGRNAYHRNYLRHRTYGLPKGGVLRLLESADWKCQICKRDVTEKSARIDHDHSCCDTKPYCGACTRGILCNSCNAGIGLLGDSVEVLLSAVEYMTSQRALFQVA